MSKILVKIWFSILKTIPFFSIMGLLFSCKLGFKNERQVSNKKEVSFELLDSIVVETVEELFLADKNEEAQQFLFNSKGMNELFITDLKGSILSKFKPIGEGPNQVMLPLEVAFWKEGIIIKETSSTHNFHFFDSNFKKITKSPEITDGMNFLTILNSHRSFSVIESDEKTIILGEELNLINDAQLSENFDNSDFYEQATTGFIYDVESKKITLLNTYPKTWKPRAERKWVGRTYTFLQALKDKNIFSILPSIGDQMFFYELKGDSAIQLSQISLYHPEREIKLPFDLKNDYVLYPYFTQLLTGGNYFFAEFYTELPFEIYNSFRSKGENFEMDPEYWATLEKYRKVKYILTDKNGNYGAVSELPIQGLVHFIDSNDIVYIKRTHENEFDYNVFYRYKVRLDDLKE